MLLLRAVLLSALLCCVAAAEDAARVIVRQWSSEDGMPDGNVTAMARTSDGLVWAGTFHGLVRMDGLRVRLVSMTRAGLPTGTQIVSLFADSRDRLWVNTYYGNHVLVDGKVQSGPWREGWPPGAHARAWAEEQDGSVLATTWNGHCLRHDGTRWQQLPSPAGSASPVSILATSSGTVWAQQDGVLAVLEKGAWKKAAAPAVGLPLRLAPAQDGGLWLLGVNGLARWSRGAWSAVLPVPEHTADMCEDSRGRVWITTAGHGAHLLDPAAGRCSPLPGIGADSFYSLLPAGAGAVWLGSSGQGIFQAWEAAPVFHEVVRPADCPQRVTGMITAPDGRTIVATREAGVFVRGEGTGFEPWPHSPREAIQAMALDSAGVLWTATGTHGVQRWENGVADPPPVIPAVKQMRSIHAMLPLPGGGMIIAGQTGIQEWNGTAVIRPRMPGGMEGQPIHALMAGGEEIHAAGERGMLLRRTAAGWVELPCEPAGTDTFTGMDRDTAGNLWLATRGSGLFRLKDGTLTAVPLAGLQDLRILTDRLTVAADRIWLADARQVVSVSLTEAQRSRGTPVDARVTVLGGPRITAVGGLLAAGGPAQGVTAGGAPWFVTGEGGVIALHTEPQPAPPPIRPGITSILRGEEQVAVPLRASSFELPPGTSSTILHVIGANPDTLEPVTHRLRVDGGEWRTHYFPDIPLGGLQPGLHQVELQSTRLGQPWSGPATTLALTVGAEWWQTTKGRALFSAAALLGTALLSYFIVKWRMRRHRAALAREREMLTLRHAALNAEERERTRIARELHDQLGGALTGLRIHAGLVHRSLTEQGSPLAERTGFISKIIDDTLPDVRRLCARLRPAVLDEMTLAQAIEWQAGEFTRASSVPCSFDCSLPPGGLPPEPTRDLAIYRIVQELLTNITRHAVAERVDISMNVTGRDLTLTVRDDGRGMDADAPLNGHFGLRGIRERAAHLGGEIHIASSPGKGTAVTFTITMPAQDS